MSYFYSFFSQFLGNLFDWDIKPRQVLGGEGQLSLEEFLATWLCSLASFIFMVPKSSLMQSWDGSREWGLRLGLLQTCSCQVVLQEDSLGSHQHPALPWDPVLCCCTSQLCQLNPLSEQYWLTLVGLVFLILSKGKDSREFNLFLNSCFQISFYFQLFCNCRVAEAAEFLVASPKTSHLDFWFICKPSLFGIDPCPSLTWLGNSQQWLWQVFALQFSQSGVHIYSAWVKRIPIAQQHKSCFRGSLKFYMVLLYVVSVDSHSHLAGKGWGCETAPVCLQRIAKIRKDLHDH